MVLLRPAAALLVLSLAASGARADEASPAAGAPGVADAKRAPTEPDAEARLVPLTYDWTVDGVVTGAFAASTFTLLLLKSELAPLQCRWCVPGPIDGDVAKSVGWSSPQTASTISDVMQVVIPVGVMGFGLLQGYRLGDPAAGWADVLLITEATSLAMLVNTVVKYAVGRARPYAWLGSTANQGAFTSSRDANLSFYSGHTTFAFAVAVSGGTLFLMQGMPGAPYVLGAGLALAAFTGYLRMAANEHYLSDVLVSAAAGSLIGWAVPYLFHRPRKGAPQAGDLLPAPGGIAIAW
jgi:membrane-associated phospholipid phosphatase